MADIPLDPEHYFPCYQPIVDLVSGAIGGYEALARYRDGEGRLCSAGPLFFGETYAPETVMAIDRRVREQALAHFVDQADAGYLALNISPDRLGLWQQGVAPTLEMIDRLGIEPHRVVIEITEGEGDLNRIQALVNDYRRAGLRVAIDDFGAGASQVDRIVALKPDVLKLDMQLFKQAARGGLSADVILAAAAMAERVGCEIVCEGVETVEELHFGIECGARFMQGFIFAQAGPQLLPSDQPFEQVRALQQYFLERKTDKLRASVVHNHRVCESVMTMRRLLMEDRASEISASELFRLGILRYYLCRPDGTQITDNFEVGPEGFEPQHRYRGCNWSHRPYFPLLLALEAFIARELVVSNAYRDAISHQLCKTYGTYIHDDLILLVDVAVSDDVLYAPLD